MKTITTHIAAASLALMAWSGTALAGDINVMNPWARASAGMAKAGAAFMQIKNDTGADDTLVAAKSDVAGRVELHTHLMEGGVMKMREVKGGIPVKNGETQKLQPGSYHVMLMGLHAPLKEGSSFPVTLTFKSGTEKTVDVMVMSPGAMGNAKGMKHGSMPGMK